MQRVLFTGLEEARHALCAEAPRIRVRDKQDRINTLWGELAALNERLAGGDAVTARKRIDYLRYGWHGKGHHGAWPAVPCRRVGTLNM